MSKLLFVVHRYAPFPGGSEYFVQRMAEEAVRQGHTTTVLSDEHKGDWNGVTVTSNRAIVFNEKWDLIIVHGSCPTQDFVLENGDKIPSPIYYMLIQPNDLHMVHVGMKNATYIGCSTLADSKFVYDHGYLKKIRMYHHCINQSCVGEPGFRNMAGITTKKMYLSAGGFWPHKGFHGLAKAFNEAQVEDTTLVLLGYDTRFGQPPEQTEFVRSFQVDDQQIVYDAMLEADLFILNSESEGFGLVLLEAMYNKLPWISTPVGGAPMLASDGYGFVYRDEAQLKYWLKNFKPTDGLDNPAFHYVCYNHMASNTLEDILGVFE